MTDTICYRLYRREWGIEHTVSGQGDPNHPVPAEPFVREASQWAERTYADSMRGSIELSANRDEAGFFWVHVRVLKPRLRDEFDNAQLAVSYAEKWRWEDWEVVARGSLRDLELSTYGLRT